MSTLKERLFAAQRTRYVTIDVPLVGEVRLRSLSAGEMRKFRDSLTDEQGKPNERLERLNELLAAACIVDESSERVFSDDDVMGGTFDELDGGAFALLAAAVRRHTNFAADPDWKAIEDAAKNLGATG